VPSPLRASRLTAARAYSVFTAQAVFFCNRHGGGAEGRELQGVAGLNMDRHLTAVRQKKARDPHAGQSRAGVPEFFHRQVRPVMSPNFRTI